MHATGWEGDGYRSGCTDRAGRRCVVGENVGSASCCQGEILTEREREREGERRGRARGSEKRRERERERERKRDTRPHTDRRRD